MFASASSRVIGAALERDHAAPGRQGAREPDRRVAAERAQLEDRARAVDAREQLQQLALVGRDRDRRQARCFARGHRGVQGLVRGEQALDDVVVQRAPKLLVHGEDDIGSAARTTRTASKPALPSPHGGSKQEPAGTGSLTHPRFVLPSV